MFPVLVEIYTLFKAPANKADSSLFAASCACTFAILPKQPYGCVLGSPWRIYAGQNEDSVT